MTHLWVRSESRANEDRTAITPDGVKQLLKAGLQVTVEESPHRVIPTEDYRKAGASIAPEGSWPGAPLDAIILGIKELPEDGSPLPHRHILFGHAYKGQPAGRILLERFKAGNGVLLDLEYLTDDNGRRLAAFGYWAGYVGAAVSLLAWAAQMRGGICGPVSVWPSRDALNDAIRAELDATGQPRPDAIVIGAKGRVGSGAADLCKAMGMAVTGWDMAETAHGGPFPEVLDHALFFNCILASPGTPVFVPADAVRPNRKLRVIGDIACDPTSDFSPVKVYDRVTDWDQPALRVADNPPLDVMAIDNLPSLLPLESSLDFAEQLLPLLRTLDNPQDPVWTRAEALYHQHVTEV